uniref:Acidic phospholipase A2 jerdoxin n=1 Tax=Protobothrops jerdonii TaxID=242841 RepID=PA2A_PROJR|nr:RecName: Full=Acidic phospholipase A2 jerdoxin; Short=svPLA2; AltName: Full=Phosphatidylcholine 2-acylhydrolase; Flags: Precursor [Protobothrops jerdonii]AAM33325.1 jerdoxin [Protobothrops jerdonii]
MRTLWIMAVLLVGVEGHLWQFREMIKEATGKEPLTTYLFYACYCGWGGRGEPKDATDRCCFVHDCCYGKLTACSPKLDIYSYSQKNEDIVCGGGTECEKQICECDKAAAICFLDNLGTYNKEYNNYSKSRCIEESPKC